jgi:thiol:disulfide interchange protein
MNTNTIKKCIFIFLALGLISCTKKDDARYQSNIKWESFDNYLAVSHDKPVFINIAADWCASSHLAEKDLLNTSKFAKHMSDNNFRTVRADVTTLENLEKVETWLKKQLQLKVDFLQVPSFVIIENNNVKLFNDAELLKYLN